MDEIEELRSSYKHSLTERHHRQSFVGSVLALVLLPSGVLLDLTVYPTILAKLSVYRISCEIAVALVCCLHLLSFSKKYPRALSLAWALAISVSMCLMIDASGDIYGPYYAGLSLLMLGVTLMLPLTLAEALVLTILTVGAYSIVLVVNFEGLNTLKQGVNNLYFLISTCFIACCSSYFSAKRRFSEYKLNYDLDLRTKQLAELDRMKSDFYANISHELRTPLTLILAPVEDLLEDKKLDKKVQVQLSYVRENTYRLLKLVNDLLDVLKLEEKKDLLEKQPVLLNGILSNIISSMEPLAARKAINLSYKSMDDSACVMGDSSALEKILINLANNALKFTESGGSVSVELWTEPGLVFVKVVDTGVGIATNDLPSIFDRFHQVDSSATRKHQGTGLGLALVKELTELQEGVVKVESQPGKGTTMTVQFPKLESAMQLSMPEPSQNQSRDEADSDGLDTLHRQASFSIAEPQSADYKSRIKENHVVADFIGARLLIVEDEPDVRNYLAEALSSIYQVDVALDGEEGLQKIREEKPDLVLLDLMLPKMDGLSVCAAVRKDPSCRQTKIMLLTARTDEQSKMTALEHGADDFLTKPFSTLEIKTRLRNLWENSGLQRELIEKNEDLNSALNELKETQGHLIQSEKLNAIGRLAAGLLHEVNNPLNFAFGTFQLLEREPKFSGDESITEMMADIRVGMERIANIVKDLKTFAYPEKTDVEKVFPLRVAVDSAVRLTSKSLYNTAVEVDVDEKLALRGSQSHIIQILVNLIENAVDAMNEAGTSNQSISIFVTDSVVNSARVDVHVKDNGPGVSAEKIALIFDPFFTTKDVGAGMGMGLSIASTIAKNHEGELRVESEEGSYTDFFFDLKRDTVVSI